MTQEVSIFAPLANQADEALRRVREDAAKKNSGGSGGSGQ